MAARVERELVLFKLRAPPGPARTELLQLVDIFRARVIDVSGIVHCTLHPSKQNPFLGSHSKIHRPSCMVAQ